MNLDMLTTLQRRALSLSPEPIVSWVCSFPSMNAAVDRKAKIAIRGFLMRRAYIKQKQSLSPVKEVRKWSTITENNIRIRG